MEPFLPLGEVSVMDGAEVKEVGTILSLVKPDGTIVVQGRSPPLDEGCVLYSRVVELQEDVREGEGIGRWTAKFEASTFLEENLYGCGEKGGGGTRTIRTM